MRAYPVHLEVASPRTFERVQLLLRLAIGIVLGWLGLTLGWVWSLLFLAQPIVAAAVVSARGSDAYLQDTAPKLWSALTWLLGFSAYMLLVTDRIPIDEQDVRADLRTTARRRVGTALARLVLSIPSVIALCLLGLVSCLLWMVAVFTILFAASVPASILHFQTGCLRWAARLAAYHASLVDEYPPFSLADTAPSIPTAMVNP